MTVAAPPQSVLDLAAEVANAARRLPLDGLTVVTGGNISARDAETGMIVITPASAPYRDMSASDIVVVDEAGQVIYGSGTPSSEMAMHLELMRRAEDRSAFAVVHTHSPYATAFSVVRTPIPLVCNEGLGLGTVRVRVTEYAAPGTIALGEEVRSALAEDPGALAILLANHGAATMADSVSQAYDLALQLEWSARVYHLAVQIGEPHLLTEQQRIAILAQYHNDDR
jgi:L-fuculose-phosphate aldolase